MIITLDYVSYTCLFEYLFLILVLKELNFAITYLATQFVCLIEIQTEFILGGSLAEKVQTRSRDGNI